MPDHKDVEIPAVNIVASEADRSVRNLLANGLSNMGMPIATDASGASTVVVLSTEALTDPEWRRQLQRHADTRIVPVTVGTIPSSSDVPSAVGDINWVVWEPENTLGSRSRVFSALRSDLSRYQTARSLTAEANAWLAEGRSPHLLISDRRRAQSAVDHLRDAVHDPLAALPQHVLEFVTESYRVRRKDRTKQLRKWGVRGLATVVVVALTVSVVATVRVLVKNNNLASQGNYPTFISERPDRLAMLSAANLLQGDVANETVARQVIAAQLPLPWSMGALNVDSDANVLDASVSEHGDRVLTVDARANLALWDTRTDTAFWRRNLGDGNYATLDASPDLARAVATVRSDLYFVHLNPWHIKRVGLPTEPTSVAYDLTRGVAVAATDSAIYIVSADGFRQLGKYTILALRRTTAGDVRALVRDGGQLAIIDPVAGKTIASTQLPEWRFEVGALGPDGRSAAVTAADRQILFATDNLAFTRTGQAVPDVVSILAILPGGRIAFAGGQFGVRILDSRTGLTLGTVCRSFGVNQSIVAAADGDVVACLNYATVDLWRTAHLSPVLPPAAGKPLGSSASLTVGEVSVSGDVTGRITVTTSAHGQSRQTKVLAAHGPITAIMISPDGRSVVAGSADGEVAQLSLSSDGVMAVVNWQAPDGAPVTQVGWADEPGRLLAHTEAGNWWTPSSCDHCDDTTQLVAHVRARMWGCYTENQIEFLTDETKKALGVSLCQHVPDAEAG
ncbi:WD40 repeat domain-containing protein [Kibdelosporangium aridum]|uniref:WD40 repeat domain-containing protein n=1 Tax=Kibdelosporangium aridum TaxID=2030 RepID=A0A1W2AYA0_KIBAR|nr:WD40 repeat domain-containing protein [Kibdelosporangium aridum]SMC65689.1 hypothetical protein SAMN05661093_01197 [Kibdelosporangium aridum]